MTSSLLSLATSKEYQEMSVHSGTIEDTSETSRQCQVGDGNKKTLKPLAKVCKVLAKVSRQEY
jgi:hypothetical protein